MATSRTAPRRRFLPAFLTIALIVPLAFSLGSARAAPTELFFSEYIEGTSNNKALEIFNGTGAPIDLAANGYAIQMFFNGNPAAGLTIGLTGTVASGDVYVVAQSAASPVILAQADQTNGSGWFNGDDAVLLLKGATVIDSIGQRGFDPGTEWGTGLTSTADNTLRRKAAIEAGDPDPNDVFDPAVQWDGFATDDFTGLGSHIVSTDAAPQVSSTTPTAGATGVAVNADVTVTFSEPVTTSGSWFSISCTTSGAHAAAASGGLAHVHAEPELGLRPGRDVHRHDRGRSGLRQRRRRPARHDVRQRGLVVHDRRAAGQDPRHPGRGAPLAARRARGLERSGHRDREGLERVLLRGSQP